MAKYEYANGERRKYHGVLIWYDSNGGYNPGYFEPCHWYVRLCTTLADGPGFNAKSKTRKEYFKTLAEAKRYIDNF